MLLEHGIHRGHIQNAIGPKIELFQGGYIEGPAGFFVEGAEAFDKKTFQDGYGFFGLAFQFSFQSSFQPTLL